MLINCKFISKEFLTHKMLSITQSHPLVKIANHALVDLPSPSNLSTWWNFGSLLGLCLSIQLVSGLFLAIFFFNNRTLAFERVVTLETDLNSTWLLRILHANGARFFFFCLYFHSGRGLYYGSYGLHLTWGIGVVILLVTIGVAFLGYVLPWGQISFWGTSVITNLASAIPYIGTNLVVWIWGGLAVGGRTLTRFFTLHFLLPFAIAALAVVHLLFLHQTGSSNPLGVSSNMRKVRFRPSYVYKDLMGVAIIFRILISLILLDPWGLGDPENFITANAIMTPIHIQPEWYFLFAYAILRSIPNKLGGVLALAFAVLILGLIVVFPPNNCKGVTFYPLNKFFFWRLVACVILLTWIGARSVEEPYILVGQCLTVYYFMFYFSYSYMIEMWDRLF